MNGEKYGFSSKDTHQDLRLLSEVEEWKPNTSLEQKLRPLREITEFYVKYEVKAQLTL